MQKPNRYIQDNCQLSERANGLPRQNKEAVTLGDALREFMDSQVLNRRLFMSAVANVCSQVLPSELAGHCRIVGLCGGQLRVAVDSPAYMYQIQLCSSQVLEELRHQYPRIPVEKIKFMLA